MGIRVDVTCKIHTTDHYTIMRTSIQATPPSTVPSPIPSGSLKPGNEREEPEEPEGPRILRVWWIQRQPSSDFSGGNDGTSPMDEDGEVWGHPSVAGVVPLTTDWMCESLCGLNLMAFDV